MYMSYVPAYKHHTAQPLRWIAECTWAHPVYSRLRRTPYALKEGQSLPRIMETLTVAVEFINLPTLANQLPALEELRKETLRSVVGNKTFDTCTALPATLPECFKYTRLHV